MKIQLDNFAGLRAGKESLLTSENMFLAAGYGFAAAGYYMGRDIEDADNTKQWVPLMMIFPGKLLEVAGEHELTKFFRKVPEGSVENIFHAVPEKETLLLDVLDMPEEFTASFKDSSGNMQELTGRLDPIPPEDTLSEKMFGQYAAGHMEVIDDSKQILKRSPDGCIAVEDKGGMYVVLGCPMEPRGVKEAYLTYNGLMSPERRLPVPEDEEKAEPDPKSPGKSKGDKSKKKAPAGKEPEDITEPETEKGTDTMSDKEQNTQEPAGTGKNEKPAQAKTKKRRTPEEIHQDAVNNAVELLEKDGYTVSRPEGEGLQNVPSRLRKEAEVIEKYLERVKAIREVL